MQVEIVDFDDNWIAVKDPVSNEACKIWYRAVYDSLGFREYKIVNADPAVLRYFGKKRLLDAIYEFEA